MNRLMPELNTSGIGIQLYLYSNDHFSAKSIGMNESQLNNVLFKSLRLNSIPGNESIQVTAQVSFPGFDSIQLMTQTTSKNLDSDQIMTQ